MQLCCCLAALLCFGDAGCSSPLRQQTAYGACDSSLPSAWCAYLVREQPTLPTYTVVRNFRMIHVQCVGRKEGRKERVVN
jgi:hypothetical protein